MPVTAARLLLIEDNHSDVFLIKSALSLQNFRHELTVLPDGEKALWFLGQVELRLLPLPHLILLDINLPKYTGHDVIKVIRRIPRCLEVPVVVVTSSDSAEDQQAMEAQGVAHYFIKPFELESFFKIGGIVKNLLLCFRNEKH